MATKVTEHFFEYDNMKFFRSNAHNVVLGTYGKKHDPIGPKAYLEPESKIKSDHLDSRTIYLTRVNFDWSTASKAEVEAGANLKFFGLGKSVAGTFTYGDAKDGKLELIALCINPGPLKTMLNTEADGARNFLAREGGDGRVVSQVWLVVDAELGAMFDTYGEGGVKVSAFGSDLSVEISGGKSGSSTLTVSPGTTFAYRLHKVSDWNKDKTRIEDMEDDYKGMN